MAQLAQNIFDEADTGALQRGIADYLNNSYRTVQIYIWRLNKVLQVDRTKIDEFGVLKDWLDEDIESMRRLRELKVSSEGGTLKGVSEALMGSVGRKWEVGE